MPTTLSSYPADWRYKVDVRLHSALVRKIARASNMRTACPKRFKTACLRMQAYYDLVGSAADPRASSDLVPRLG